ncbi:MAG: outer membrane beta-barrel domain-containing protein [Proteobacteria bacterium]|nr:outer membrane beta-barrel domain-containing protein [Pseudomonadota bacterium]
MKRARIELAGMFAALLLLPSTLYAQDDTMSFGEDEVAAGQGQEGEAGAAPGDAMTFGEGEPAAGEGEGQPAEGEPPAEGGGAVSDSDVLGALGVDAAGGTAPAEQPAATEEPSSQHPIWAVQQVYALRARRFDFQPTFGVSLNDPYVQHQSITLALSYYITEVLGVGLSFNWYGGLGKETDLNYSVSRATHQTIPINEYQWGGQINFTYVPIYGKFAMFKEWILHWDVWVIGGGGFIFTRPIPVIDPEYRSFDYKIKFCFNIGLGGRLYLSRFLAIALELRDYIFPEELENRTTFSDPEDREVKGNWVDDNFKLTNNVMLQIGVTLFLPFTFEYKLPK